MADQNKNELNSNGYKDNKHEYSSIPYHISRQVLLQEEVNQLSGYGRDETNLLNSLKRPFDGFSIKNCIHNLLPVSLWLPNYNIKKQIMGDFLAGLTVAVMHVPQGMAYGLLAGVQPINGLYMAFFPCLVYFLFGTSRHISIGTFALISIMVSKTVGTYATAPLTLTATNATSIPGLNLTDSLEVESMTLYTPLQVVTAVSLVVGIYQLLLCFFQLGTLASLLSEPLVNGFTTAAAVHVIVSQTKDLLGIQIPKHKGAFKIIFTIIDVCQSVVEANKAAVTVSVIVIIIMIIMTEIIKPWVAKHSKFPVPSELIAVVGGTVASYLLDFGPKYNITLVGNIPTGLPYPEPPPLSLLRLVAIDSIAITIVSYSIVMSMALIFAKKHAYEVRANQELLALGLANITGSFFSCLPIACSLSRSLIQEQTGGKTQLASVVSSAFILVLLLWVGKYFECLPRCVLAAVICVALKGMFMQAKDFKKYYREGAHEAIVWLSTFFCVVLIDIDIGLLFGVVVSLVVLYLKGWKSHSCLLGVLPETGIYVDLRHHKSAEIIPQIKIFRYIGSVNFASRSNFKKSLYELININYRTLRRASVAMATETLELQGMRYLIVDLSSIAHIDPSACKTLSEIQHEMKLIGIKFLMAQPSDRVYDAIIHSVLLGEGPFEVLSTIHDAVVLAQSKMDD